MADGDYHLVDTPRIGTYWRSPDGIVVRLASAERTTRDAASRSAGHGVTCFAMLAARVAGNDLVAQAKSEPAISRAVRGTPNPQWGIAAAAASTSLRSPVAATPARLSPGP